MIQFKPAKTINDYRTIAILAKEIWTEHYEPIIGIDQVNYMLKKFQSQSSIKEQIEESQFNYFIINNHENIGYLSIKKEGESLFLSKIYIAKPNRGQGLGKASMAFIEQQAEKMSCSKIYLTVNKYNTNSIKAYQKIGFKIVEELVMDIGNDYVMDDYKMEKVLIN